MGLCLAVLHVEHDDEGPVHPRSGRGRLAHRTDVGARSRTPARNDALSRATRLLPDRRYLRYTGYLADVELDHAQDILADVIGAVVTALRPNFRLAKLEGDAAFTFMTAEKVDGSMLLDTIERRYFGFRRRRRDVRQATSCDCNACAQIPDLDLKFVVHHGAALFQKVAGRPELLGSDVVVAHRLLKNDVVERLGMSAYALVSQKCIDASDIDPTALGMREHTETYERIGDVPPQVAWNSSRSPGSGCRGSRL
jgi:hypothetical protein